MLLLTGFTVAKTSNMSLVYLFYNYNLLAQISPHIKLLTSGAVKTHRNRPTDPDGDVKSLHFWNMRVQQVILGN